MLAEYKFIQVNNSIQDYSLYVKEMLLVKKYLKLELMELLIKENFILDSEISKSYGKTELILYNKQKDLEIKIELKKRNDEHFV